MSCCDHPGLMPVDQMINALQQQVRAVTQTENVPVGQALGRVLAADITSAVQVPPADNSAMDGYALRLCDYQPGKALPISQRIPAGAAPAPLQAGTVARIFTGASVPEGADVVVMQEVCREDNNQLICEKNLIAGDNIRAAGQDIQHGQVVLEKGRKLQPQDLGLLASIGVANVSVYRRLKIALISTGDEIREPGETLAPGQIYNSNRYTLLGLCQAMGFDVLDLGTLADDFAITRNAFAAAAEQADVIISSGGVSVGEEDHVKAAVSALGELNLWRMAIKPGKPFAFGRVGQTPFIGLPGNPSAVFVTFLIVARGYLLACQGVKQKPSAPLQLPIDFELKKPGKRREYYRVRIVQKDGQLMLEKHPNQSSGVLSSASWADGFAILELDQTFERGQLVPYISFSQLLS
ncbi:MAG: molybdopterin molybdotransferase MoeA [Oceanospirillaceae bacterium]|nr:molybdopterin molybdotransferase MoeA [Oceanospirillaceae bacterium]MCP5349766.1 molybdopterin molybdotransferase MoeA [Oceanospirillaceae bacterium]